MKSDVSPADSFTTLNDPKEIYMQHPVIDAVDAQLKAAGLPTYTELLGRSHDVAEGIEDMKNLPGSVPARLKKLKLAIARAAGNQPPAFRAAGTA